MQHDERQFYSYIESIDTGQLILVMRKIWMKPGHQIKNHITCTNYFTGSIKMTPFLKRKLKTQNSKKKEKDQLRKKSEIKGDGRKMKKKIV